MLHAELRPNCKKSICSILYVDDDPDTLYLGKYFLEKTQEFKVETLTSAIEALNSPYTLSYDAIISDYAMPEMDGIAFLKELRKKCQDIPFILFTCLSREDVVIEAIKSGASFYLQKGGDPDALFAELAHQLHTAVHGKQTEIAFKESEKTITDIIDFLPDATFAIDRSGIIIAWNRAIEEMTGYSSHSMIGMNTDQCAISLYGSLRPILINLINKPDEQESLFYQNLSRSGNALMAETYLLNKEGNQILVLEKTCPLYNQAGVFTGAIESIRDITEIRKTELELRESEEHFRAISEQSPDIIIRVDRNFQILYCNPRITDYLGISVDHIIGKNLQNYQGTRANVTPWLRSVKKVFESGMVIKEELQLDATTWFDCLFYPEYGPHKEIRAVTSSNRDITLTKQNNKEKDNYYRSLLVQREFTKTLLDAIPVPVYWKDTNRRYLGCNQAYANFLGLTPNEVIGKKLSDIWQETELCKITTYDHELMSSGYISPHQIKLPDKTGNFRELLISKNCFPDYQGNIAGIVEVMQDITEHTQLLSDYKYREELFRMIFTQSSDLFIIITQHLEISFISPRVEYLSGFLTDEILGPISRFVHPDDYPGIKYQVNRLIQSPTSSEVAEFRTMKRDGSYMILEGIAVNCIDNPAIHGILITARDITSRKKTELELSRMSQLFKTVMDTSPVLFALFDITGNVIFANKACTVQFGIPDDTNVRLPISDIFSLGTGKNWKIIFSDIEQTKCPSVHEFKFKPQDKILVLSAIFFPIQEEAKTLIGFIGLDITEKQDLLLKLDKSLSQNETLEQLVRERTQKISDLLDLKDSLITAIAHELRTPLTPLTVLPSLLIEEENQLKRIEIINILKNNTASIANIVEKILLLANLEISYKVEDISEVDLSVVIENLLQMYERVAKKKGINIINEVRSPQILLTSSSHITSILDNIVSNAIKYSEQGGSIWIFVEEKPDDINLHIRDTGIGMTKEELMKIFEPFFRADPSRHDRTSPGLGLSVTKRLLQVIGGKISIKSPGPGKGTEVILIFKRRTPV